MGATRHDHGGEVVSVEDYLSTTLAEVNRALAVGIRMRDGLALRLHALQMASDERVAEAVDDYESRVAEDRPYEDATSVEELIAEARSRR